MPLSPADSHIDKFLTNLLVGYRPQGMIWDQVAPVVPVAKQSDLYAKIDKGNWFRRPNTQRSPGAGANEVNYTVSSGRYACTNRELATVLADEVVANADDPHDPARRQAELLTDQLNLDAEIRVYNATVGGVGSSTTLTGINAWDQFNTSDPLTDFEVAQEAIRSTTGYKPNLCVLGLKSWLKLRRHPDIVRAIYPGAGVGGTADLAQLANLIGVGKVLIPETIYNTAAEGAADTFTDVWSTHCILSYTAPNPGIMVPTYMAAFRWNGSPIANFAVQRWRPDGRKAEILQVGYYQDENIVATELGFMIQTGITA